MPLEIFIPRDPITNSDQKFKYPHELQATLNIYRALASKYAGISAYCAMVVNLESTPIDILILHNTGMGIIDLKHYTGPLYGDANTAWWSKGQSNQKIEIECGNHTNPFKQVASYRNSIRGRLITFASEHRSLPPWLKNPDNYLTQGAVVFTAQPFDTSGLMNTPHEHHVWFDIKWLHEVPDWVFSLQFGPGSKQRRDRPDLILRKEDIRLLVSEFFKAHPWVEIEEYLPQRAFGILTLTKQDQSSQEWFLNRDETTIGRADNNTVNITEDYKSVSRQHAIIRRMPDESVVIFDLSKYGVFINDKSVPKEHGMPLQDGDIVVLGKKFSRRRDHNICSLKYSKLKEPLKPLPTMPSSNLIVEDNDEK